MTRKTLSPGYFTSFSRLRWTLRRTRRYIVSTDISSTTDSWSQSGCRIDVDRSGMKKKIFFAEKIVWQSSAQSIDFISLFSAIALEIHLFVNKKSLSFTYEVVQKWRHGLNTRKHDDRGGCLKYTVSRFLVPRTMFCRHKTIDPLPLVARRQ